MKLSPTSPARVMTELSEENRCISYGEYWPAAHVFFAHQSSAKDQLPPTVLPVCAQNHGGGLSFPAEDPSCIRAIDVARVHAGDGVLRAPAHRGQLRRSLPLQLSAWRGHHPPWPAVSKPQAQATIYDKIYFNEKIYFYCFVVFLVLYLLQACGGVWRRGSNQI